jgi:hypothetical protein
LYACSYYHCITTQEKQARVAAEAAAAAKAKEDARIAAEQQKQKEEEVRTTISLCISSIDIHNVELSMEKAICSSYL